MTREEQIDKVKELQKRVQEQVENLLVAGSMLQITLETLEDKENDIMDDANYQSMCSLIEGLTETKISFGDDEWTGEA